MGICASEIRLPQGSAQHAQAADKQRILGAKRAFLGDAKDVFRCHQRSRRIAECRRPVVVHVVQHVAHPPVELEDWPDDDHGSRLVFVTCGLARETVARLFAGITAVADQIDRPAPSLDQ